MTKNKEFSRNVMECDDNVFRFNQYLDRLMFLKDVGVTSLVLTGSASEPILNEDMLGLFDEVNRSLPCPFTNIDVQTSGTGLTKSKLTLLESIKVKTISLSVSSFESDVNARINNTNPDKKVNIEQLCHVIKREGFNLRLSLNMNREGFRNADDIERLFEEAKNLDADQITFRKLYYPKSAENTKQAEWIRNNQLPPSFWSKLRGFVENEGTPLHRLTFGAVKYSVNGLSTVVDYDCMAKDNIEALKYAILRRNLKLYSDWEDPASLIF
jgi:MoaA/NifB/PqqE/SkfB family radical SAM enzyme